MSNQQTNQDSNYQNYLKSLNIFSRCIYPVVHAVTESNGNIYNVDTTINLEKYCVYERNQVEKYRSLLNQDIAN